MLPKYNENKVRKIITETKNTGETGKMVKAGTKASTDAIKEETIKTAAAGQTSQTDKAPKVPETQEWTGGGWSHRGRQNNHGNMQNRLLELCTARNSYLGSPLIA